MLRTIAALAVTVSFSGFAGWCIGNYCAQTFSLGVAVLVTIIVCVVIGTLAGLGGGVLASEDRA